MQIHDAGGSTQAAFLNQRVELMHKLFAKITIMEKHPNEWKPNSFSIVLLVLFNILFKTYEQLVETHFLCISCLYWVNELRFILCLVTENVMTPANMQQTEL